MEITILKIAAWCAGIYVGFRIICEFFNLIADIVYEWIDPHVESGSLYRDYVNIGHEISKIKNFSQLQKTTRLVDQFSKVAEGNSEAMHYAENLKSLLNHKELYLRRSAAYLHTVTY